MTKEQVTQVLEDNKNTIFSKAFIEEIGKYYTLIFIGSDIFNVYFIEELGMTIYN